MSDDGSERHPSEGQDLDTIHARIEARHAEADARAERGESLSACRDCGVDAWWFRDYNGQIVHEDFYVKDELWDAACPDDDVIRWQEAGVNFGEGQWVLCIGCFERRPGRKLVRTDFKGRPRSLFGTPPSLRFRLRYKARGGTGTKRPASSR